MKRLFSFVLLLAIALMTFVGCNSDVSDESSTHSENSSAVSVGTASDDGDASDTASKDDTSGKCPLPDISWNTTLKWVSAYSAGDTSDIRYYEIWCEEELGDVLSRAVVERSRWLENQYGISIEMVWTANGETVNYAKLASESGEKIDVITAPVYNIATNLNSGYFYDISEINADFNDGNGWLDLTASYWDQNFIRDYSFGNRVFMLTGDICLYDDENTWAMFFNKDMIEEYGFENPYTTVKNGDWTLDTLYSYCKQVTQPDGDTLTWDATANHKWGMVTQTYDLPMFMMGCGQCLIEKDANDLPYMRIDSERNIDVSHKVLEMLLDENVVGVADFYGAWNSGVYGVERGIFANGHAMFIPSSIAMLSSPECENSEVNIGVIPMPKADDLQDDYSSSSNVYWLQTVAIPVANKDNLGATLFALEAMAWYGQRYINPVYYEKVLKLQKFHDEDAEEMLDLIFKNRTYDMGIAYSWGNMLDFYDTLFCSKNNDIVSLYESNRDKFQAAIDSAIAQFTNE